jgi:hypothetical protein
MYCDKDNSAVRFLSRESEKVQDIAIKNKINSCMLYNLLFFFHLVPVHPGILASRPAKRLSSIHYL